MSMLVHLSKRLVTSEYTSFVLRLLIGGIFVYASMGKIPYPAEFAENVAAYGIVPRWGVNAVAVMLPWMELLAGLFLMIGLASRAAAVVTGVLLVGFSGGLITSLIQGTPITCGCFDRVGPEISWLTLGRDIGLLLFTVQIACFDRIFLLHWGGFLMPRRHRAR